MCLSYRNCYFVFKSLSHTHTEEEEDDDDDVHAVYKDSFRSVVSVQRVVLSRSSVSGSL